MQNFKQTRKHSIRNKLRSNDEFSSLPLFCVAGTVTVTGEWLLRESRHVPQSLA
jgi:hypothetical protein